MLLDYTVPKKNNISVVYKSKGSKFVGRVLFADSEANAKILLQQTKKEFFDATHVCYAFRIGINNILERSSDDGEPSNTAGKPILREMVSKNITQCLVIVARYYGGTPLGVGGLISAYAETAKMALTSAETQTLEIYFTVRVSIPADKDNEIYRISSICKSRVAIENYSGVNTLLKLEIPLRNKEKWQQLTSDFFWMKIQN